MLHLEAAWSMRQHVGCYFERCVRQHWPPLQHAPPGQQSLEPANDAPRVSTSNAARVVRLTAIFFIRVLLNQQGRADSAGMVEDRQAEDPDRLAHGTWGGGGIRSGEPGWRGRERRNPPDVPAQAAIGRVSGGPPPRCALASRPR